MESELIQAIQQISEELGKTSVLDVASFLVGAISIALTIVVLWYNNKSIKLTQRSVQQAIDLQLFEKRLELYNAITDDRAFYDAPLSLKIAYNDEIYHLYCDVVELCEKRWVKIWEFAQVYGAITLENREHGNICYELYALYADQVENQIQNQNTGGFNRYKEDGKQFSLEDNWANANCLHKELCKKHSQLEEKMRVILNQSITL